MDDQKLNTSVHTGDTKITSTLFTLQCKKPRNAVEYNNQVIKIKLILNTALSHAFGISSDGVVLSSYQTEKKGSAYIV